MPSRILPTSAISIKKNCGARVSPFLPLKNRKIVFHRSSSHALSRSVQAQLGQRLRQFYEALALGEQPVPERFIEIINRLDESKPEQQSS